MQAELDYDRIMNLLPPRVEPSPFLTKLDGNTSLVDNTSTWERTISFKINVQHIACHTYTNAEPPLQNILHVIIMG